MTKRPKREQNQQEEKQSGTLTNPKLKQTRDNKKVFFLSPTHARENEDKLKNN